MEVLADRYLSFDARGNGYKRGTDPENEVCFVTVAPITGRGSPASPPTGIAVSCGRSSRLARSEEATCRIVKEETVRNEVEEREERKEGQEPADEDDNGDELISVIFCVKFA